MSPSDSGHISFACRCGQIMRVPVEKAGAKGRCRACGRKLVVPVPERRHEAEEPAIPDYLPPVRPRELEEKYDEEDLLTCPETPMPERVQATPGRALPVDVLREKPRLLSMLSDILRYPLSDKTAVQIFLTGAILFSPLMWKLMYLGAFLPCVGELIILILIVSIRLMYFSYLLLIIQKSAEGKRTIPELPVFQSWEENLSDLIRVLGASAIAFSPFLVYALSVNVEFIGRMVEASARGESLGPGALASISSKMGPLLLLYATAAFYMPMVLMILVVTKKFGKAVNPLFVFRSITRIAGEYLAAMFIIFFFLRGSLTLFTIIRDVLDFRWLDVFGQYVGEPVIEFYALVVTMHVIGLLYYRNGERLNW